MSDSYTPWLMQICPICGKEFLPASQHYWRIGDVPSRERLVCSYSCMRKWEKTPKNKRKVDRKRVAVRILETGEVFESVADCAKHLGIPRDRVSKMLYNGRAYNGYHIEKVWK